MTQQPRLAATGAGVHQRRVAVEVNEDLAPRTRHDVLEIRDGDRIEIVTLVGGGSGNDDTELYEPPLQVGSFALRSRLIAGSGKYASFELMQRCHQLCGCHALTVAVRRERLLDKDGRNILEFIDLNRYLVLPNTAGCFSAADAIRHARLGREILSGFNHPGSKWVKLECLADPRTLLPDPVETLAATKELVKDGFEVLVYASDDPVMARRLKEAGATSVMPAGTKTTKRVESVWSERDAPTATAAPAAVATTQAPASTQRRISRSATATSVAITMSTSRSPSMVTTENTRSVS